MCRREPKSCLDAAKLPRITARVGAIGKGYDRDQGRASRISFDLKERIIHFD
jgi:hypothetical protein